MRYYRGVLTTDEGKDIPLKPIGKGMFSKAYVTTKGRKKVYLITQEDDAGDYSKEILAWINQRHRSAYLPKVKKEGCIDADGACVYSMPLYEAPLRKAGHPKAWQQYRVLKKCWEEATSKVQADLRKRYGWKDSAYQYRFQGYNIMMEVIECAKQKKVARGLTNALQLLADESANYGSGYTFEFSPRNLATSGKDQLVLLDVVFDLESVAKRTAAAQKKARAMRRW